MIGNKSFWNGGYGSDATVSMLYYIFKETEIENVYLHTLATNIRAQKAFKKAGFDSPKHVKKGRYEFIKMITDKKSWLEKFNDSKVKIIPVVEQHLMVVVHFQEKIQQKLIDQQLMLLDI